MSSVSGLAFFIWMAYLVFIVGVLGVFSCCQGWRFVSSGGKRTPVEKKYASAAGALVTFKRYAGVFEYFLKVGKICGKSTGKVKLVATVDKT